MFMCVCVDAMLIPVLLLKLLADFTKDADSLKTSEAISVDRCG